MRKEIVIEIYILSGKGGVGKTTFAIAVAQALMEREYNVGLLDFDIGTPNIPLLFGMGKTKIPVKKIIEPVQLHPEKTGICTSKTLETISIGFDAECGITADGVRQAKFVKEMITNVQWDEEMDYMVMDMPPGTSDVLLEAVSDSKNGHAVIVIEPTSCAVQDATRTMEILAISKKIKVAGVVENCRGNYGKDKGKHLAEKFNVPFLGRIAFHKNIPQNQEEGKNVMKDFKDFQRIMDKLLQEVNGHE